MKIDKRLRLATGLSLVAGIFILLAGLIAVPYQWRMAFWRHGEAPWLGSFAISLMIVSGALTTVSAISLYRNPQYHVIFGLLILLSSALSLIALGIASPQDHTRPVTITIILMLLGMTGGALGITYKHNEETKIE